MVSIFAVILLATCAAAFLQSPSVDKEARQDQYGYYPLYPSDDTYGEFDNMRLYFWNDHLIKTE